MHKLNFKVRKRIQYAVVYAPLVPVTNRLDGVISLDETIRAVKVVY